MTKDETDIHNKTLSIILKENGVMIAKLCGTHIQILILKLDFHHVPYLQKHVLFTSRVKEYDENLLTTCFANQDHLMYYYIK